MNNQQLFNQRCFDAAVLSVFDEVDKSSIILKKLLSIYGEEQWDDITVMYGIYISMIGTGKDNTMGKLARFHELHEIDVDDLEYPAPTPVKGDGNDRPVGRPKKVVKDVHKEGVFNNNEQPKNDEQDEQPNDDVQTKTKKRGRPAHLTVEERKQNAREYYKKYYQEHKEKMKQQMNDRYYRIKGAE